MGNQFFETAAFSSQDQTWRTPQKFWEKLNNQYQFTLDVCALQNSTLVPNNWYGPDHPDLTRQNCLTRNWSKDTNNGWAYMNPPYGRVIKHFMAKAAEENQNNKTKIICLVPARTDTAWWHDSVIPFASDIQYIRGRLKFNDGPNSAPFPSAVVIYGN